MLCWKNMDEGACCTSRTVRGTVVSETHSPPNYGVRSRHTELAIYCGLLLGFLNNVGLVLVLLQPRISLADDALGLLLEASVSASMRKLLRILVKRTYRELSRLLGDTHIDWRDGRILR